MLIAVRDKYGGVIVINSRLMNDGNEEERCSNIAARFGESIFHHSGTMESDGLEKMTFM